jgi:hypothetical protein
VLARQRRASLAGNELLSNETRLQRVDHGVLTRGPQETWPLDPTRRQHIFLAASLFLHFFFCYKIANIKLYYTDN